MGNLAVQENSPKELKSETIRRAVSQASAEQFEKAMNAPQPEPRPPHQVEVFIHDSRLKSYGSQFGHVSIAVGNQLYSMSHSGLYQTNVNDFIKRQQNFRDTIGFVLNTTPAQAKAISEKMLEFDGTTYDLLRIVAQPLLPLHSKPLVFKQLTLGFYLGVPPQQTCSPHCNIHPML